MFSPSTTDYFYIHLNQTSMRQHLRMDKIMFWNEVIPALRKGFQGEARTSFSKDSVSSSQTYQRTMWVFVGVSVALLFLLLVALVALVKQRNRLILEDRWTNEPVNV